MRGVHIVCKCGRGDVCTDLASLASPPIFWTGITHLGGDVSSYSQKLCLESASSLSQRFCGLCILLIQFSLYKCRQTWLTSS